MATNNSVNVGLAGSTGSGNFVGANSPTFVTPTLGAATATSIAFNPTTGGPIGTILVNNADAGFVGELITSNVADGSGVSVPASGNIVDVTSISLTAGDWDVWGNANGKNTGNNITLTSCWCSTTSATLPDQSLISTFVSAGTSGLGGDTPYIRINVSGTTTVYMTITVTFGAGTQTASGSIFARRAR